MSEAVKTPEAEPLRLEAGWRIPEGRRGATVHALRVVPGESRRMAADVDELRALVAEMVREELRSDLGRRMTGAIRRLVRDEVSRIFTRLGPR